ncbi:GspE/PulE family protein [Xanthomonas euvesicatoria]
MSAVLKLDQQPPSAAVTRAERSTLSVWSGPNGPHPAPDDLRSKVCLLEDGTLLIRNGTGLDQYVRAYREELRQKQVHVRTVDATLEEIAAAYERDAQLGGDGNSDKAISIRQAQVVSIIRNAMEMNASDVHFIVQSQTGRLRYRIDGVMVDQNSLPAAEMRELIATMYQSMCDVADTTFKAHKAQDARLSESYLQSTGLYGARIATMPRTPGQLVVLRLLYSTKNRPTSMSELGYTKVQQPFFERMTMEKEGMYIFSGPTGSGKSTSLQVSCESMLANYNDELHGITLEDPPEYTISGWDQCAVPRNEKHQADWGASIRAMMRCDLDVAMIGEMRDLESVEAATEIALTGHLVMTTLHANCAPGILQRLSEMGVTRDIYGDPGLIRGLINQKLCPLLCAHCKRPWATEKSRFPDSLIARVERYCDPAKVYVTGAGCEHCRKGVKGRRVIGEVLQTTQSFMDVFCTKGRLPARKYWVEKEGGITRTSVLIDAINEGVIDPAVGEQYISLLDRDEELNYDAA